jgi:enoyl-CoA hydratase/carnithine racemase
LKTPPPGERTPADSGTPTLAIEGSVATITLRRPQLANRLEVVDLEALHEHLAVVDAAREVRVLRLLSTGRHFCSGFNVGQVAAANVNAGARFEALANAIEAARPVTIAAIQGGVFGGACDLALACDFRLGTPACEMFVPAARLGLHYYRSGLERFVDRLGLAAAKRVMLAAETFDANGMREIGMLDRVVDPAERLMDEVDALSADLAGMAPLALLPMKKHLNRIAHGRLDAQDIARDIAAAEGSEDLREGSLAWREKRAPRFMGR